MANLLETKQKTTCAAILVETLSKLGVDSIFGYPGAAVLSIYNELSKVKEIKHYLARHEQSAVHAAEGYARVSGKTGVVLVTSGPGFTNTVTGIANAYADSTPLVILAGDVPTDNFTDKIFQNVDIQSIVQSCCKKVFKLEKNNDIEVLITKAFNEAENGVNGPVVVILPRNILEAEYETRPQPLKQKQIVKQNFSEQANALSNLLKTASKPLILIGGGCINASEEIKNFVSDFKCPVVSTLMGIGVYPSDDDLYLGMIGVNGVEKANDAFKNSDLLLCLGVAFSDRTTCKSKDFSNNHVVVSVNKVPQNRFVDYEIVADVKDFLKILTKFVDKTEEISNNRANWLNEVRLLKNQDLKQNFISNRLHSSYVLKTLSEFTKKYEPIVVTDVGQHQMLTAQFFNFNKPRKFITSGGLGTMGFGLPASIGAHIANPQNLILNITGDGSFQMNSQELATCREHNIPVKIIIMNNGYLGMVREMQEKIYSSTYQVKMINPDFTKIAEAYDLLGIRVTDKQMLIPALEKAINHEGTVIIDIAINSFETVE